MTSSPRMAAAPPDGPSIAGGPSGRRGCIDLPPGGPQGGPMVGGGGIRDRCCPPRGIGSPGEGERPLGGCGSTLRPPGGPRGKFIDLWRKFGGPPGGPPGTPLGGGPGGGLPTEGGIMINDDVRWLSLAAAFFLRILDSFLLVSVHEFYLGSRDP